MGQDHKDEPETAAEGGDAIDWVLGAEYICVHLCSTGMLNSFKYITPFVAKNLFFNCIITDKEKSKKNSTFLAKQSTENYQEVKKNHGSQWMNSYHVDKSFCVFLILANLNKIF